MFVEMTEEHASCMEVDTSFEGTGEHDKIVPGGLSWSSIITSELVQVVSEVSQVM